MKEQHEIIEVIVKMKITYDTPAARKGAISHAHRLPIDMCSCGTKGSYSVRRGKIRLAPNQK